MLIRNRFLAVFALLLYLVNPSFAIESESVPQAKHPDYSQEYLGRDKFENFNRKVFIFNSALNKYVIRPVDIVWASIMPKYGMDRLQCAYTNIEYPKRLVSSLIQKDFKTTKNETLRFLTNSTIGLGGLYDPAKKYLKIEPAKADMEQALAKLHVKQGPYLVLPGGFSATPRGIAGKLLDTSLDPSLYIASPITALVKTGVLINKTTYMQPFAKMIESTYADPYDIAKKLYGIENYIKNFNLYKKETLEVEAEMLKAEPVDNVENVGIVVVPDENNFLKEDPLEGEIEKDKHSVENFLQDINPVNQDLKADIVLSDYNPQHPVTDAMRTALFDVPDINDSMWSELSVWNRCFSKQIKTSSVSIDKDREDYKYKYILQKDKTAPVVIIYPSIGEGIASRHSVVLAKLFYDEGYSAIIQGSHFNWEFVKSAPESYKPGIPSEDANYLRIVTSKIIDSLASKYNFEPREKVLIGTSFGAMTTLFIADKESRDNTLNITKYISINPPIELVHALKELDKNGDAWNKNQTDLKHRVAITASKIIRTAQEQEGDPSQKLDNKKIVTLPFSEEEAKIITGFILHQKLSDLIFTIENVPMTRKTDIYDSINRMNYRDYAEKYLLSSENKTFEDLDFKTSLHSIAEFLRNNNNYKIYHTIDDYFVNQQQLRQLREYSAEKVVLLNNGSHLGFLYRKEFIDDLKKEICLNGKDKKEPDQPQPHTVQEPVDPHTAQEPPAELQTASVPEVED